jgi:hypothetical protein
MSTFTSGAAAAAVPGVAVFLLPLQNTPQTFNIRLANQDYLMTVRWNDAADAGWQMSLTNADTNVDLVVGIPLIVGADLLAGLEYLEIGGSLFVYTSGDQLAVPTLDNLGIDSNVYFITDVLDGQQ